MSWQVWSLVWDGVAMLGVVALWRASVQYRRTIGTLVAALREAREELDRARERPAPRELEIRGQLHRQGPGQDGSWVFDCVTGEGERRSFLLMAQSQEEAQAQAEVAVRSWLESRSQGEVTA